MRYPPEYDQCLPIRRKHTHVVRIPIMGLTGAFCVGNGVGNVVCTVSGVVVTVRMASGGGVGVAGRTVERTGCGVVKISIAAGALRE